jgi:hypothetical protein
MYVCISQPLITKILEIALYLKKLKYKIHFIFLKSFPDKFIEMRYNVLPCRCGFVVLKIYFYTPLHSSCIRKMSNSDVVNSK